MRATTNGRGRGKVAAALAALVALTAGFFAFAPSAFAHHPEITGESVCEANGTFTVNWTVGNSESDASRYMLIRAYTVTPNVGTTTGLTADGSYDGIVGPGYSGPGTVVPPSGEVTATTTGIPGNTPSITLEITGRWKYGSGNISTVTETRSFTVELGGQCTPRTGSLSISKVVTGNSAPPGASYTINYDNGAGTSGSVTVQGGETETVEGLPFGSYTLNEVSAPAGATISPNPAVVGADSPDVVVTVTNPYPNVGSFSVNKLVTGETGGYVAGSTFTVGYDCTNGATGSLTLTNGATESVGNLPVGTTCTLVESSKPPTSGPSYVYGPESWDPSNVITIGSTSNVAVVLTNPIERIVGGFSVTKQVTGQTGGYVPGSEFAVSYDCDNGSEGTLLLDNGDTQGVGDLPLGTVCTLAETAKPSTSGPSYVYGPESFSPSDTVTIVANDDDNVVQVTLTNPIERRFGSLTVTKIVTGATAGYVDGSTFDFELFCQGAFGASFILKAGETSTFDDIPLGTTCTLTEVGVPDPVEGYEYQTPVLTPADGTVTIASDTVPVTLTAENPLVWLPAASADIVNDCESGGALVTLRNDGGGEVVFQIVVDGENFGPTHTVGSEGEQTVLVPLDEDQEATITVEAEGFGTVTEKVVQLDCENPAATFSTECTEGGVVVTLTNDGESPVDLTVRKDGEVVKTVTVGAEPVDVLVPMDEDETSTITVTNGDSVVDEQDVTYDCVPPDTVPPDTNPPGTNPPGSVLTPEVLGIQETPLPTTGSNVFGMVSLAAGLILAGASLIGLTRRRS